MKKNLCNRIENITEEVQVLKKELAYAQEQKIKAETERDIYKKLYEEERNRYPHISIPYIKTEPEDNEGWQSPFIYYKESNLGTS